MKINLICIINCAAHKKPRPKDWTVKVCNGVQAFFKPIFYPCHNVMVDDDDDVSYASSLTTLTDIYTVSQKTMPVLFVA